MAHEVFGVAPTINAANYVYFLALQKVEVIQVYQIVPFSPKWRCPECIHQRANQSPSWSSRGDWLVLRKGMDIYWRDHLQCPTEEEYKQMISDSMACSIWSRTETGGLLRLSIGLMQAFSDNHTDFIPLLVGIISVIYIRIELESSIRFEMIMSIYAMRITQKRSVSLRILLRERYLFWLFLP